MAISNAGLAGMLGRADLGMVGVAPSNVPQDPYAFGLQRRQQNDRSGGGGTGSGAGRLSAGFLAGAVVGLGAFYVWTRSHQEQHFHTSIDSILLYGVSAIVVINVTRLAAGKMATQGGAVGDVGASLGALVHFGS